MSTHALLRACVRTGSNLQMQAGHKSESFFQECAKKWFCYCAFRCNRIDVCCSVCAHVRVCARVYVFVSMCLCLCARARLTRTPRLAHKHLHDVLSGQKHTSSSLRRLTEARVRITRHAVMNHVRSDDRLRHEVLDLGTLCSPHMTSRSDDLKSYGWMRSHDVSAFHRVDRRYQNLPLSLGLIIIALLHHISSSSRHHIRTVQ